MIAQSQRVAVISGGSHGFGRTVAAALAANGYAVVLLHSPRGRDTAVAALVELRAVSPASFVLSVDVSDSTAVETAFGEVVAALGRVDAVANFAGYLALATLDELDLDDFDRVHATVVRGTFVLCKYAARVMRPGGSILNLTSAATRLSLPATSVYASAKAAVEAMTRVIAVELRDRDIAVNLLSVAPTSNETLLTAATMPDAEVAAIATRLLVR